MDNLSCIPKLLKDSIDEIKVDGSDEHYIVAKSYPELKRIRLNNVSKFIFDNIDGKTSIAGICELIKSHFKNVPEEAVLNDIMSFLFSCWKMELVEWIGKNPYSEAYEKSIDEYKCCILSATEAAKRIEKLNDSGKLKTRVDIKKDVQVEGDIIKRRNLYASSKYCLVKCLDKDVMLYEVSLKSTEQNSLDFHIYYTEDLDKDGCEKIYELIKWSAIRYTSGMRMKCLRLDAKIDVNDKSLFMDMLLKVGFTESGVLKKQYLIEDQLVDAKIMSKDII